MEIQIEKLVFCALFAANFYDKVHGYCLRGKGESIKVMKTGKSPKAAVAIGSRITLEVRYKGFFNVKWYLNGKEILNSSKSKHFELISIGNTHGLKALKIRNFKKEIAGEYKIRLNTTGCVYMKSIQVEVEKFEGRHYINQLFEVIPFLSTRAGFFLLLGLIALIFLIIPLMTCCGLCLKLKRVKGRKRTLILLHEEQPLLHKKQSNIEGKKPVMYGKQPEHEKEPEMHKKEPEHEKEPEIYERHPEMGGKQLGVPGKQPQMHWKLPEMHGKQPLHGKKGLSHGKLQQPPQDLWNLGGWDDYSPPTDCRKVVAFGRTTPKPDDETIDSSTKK